MTFPIFAAMGGSRYSNDPQYLNAMLPLAAGYNYDVTMTGESTDPYIVGDNMYARSQTRWYALTGNDYSQIYKVYDNDYNTTLVLQGENRQVRNTALGRRISTSSNANVSKIKIKNTTRVYNKDNGQQYVDFACEAFAYYTTTNNVNDDRLVRAIVGGGSLPNSQGVIALGQLILHSDSVLMAGTATRSVTINSEFTCDYDLPDGYEGYLIIVISTYGSAFGQIRDNTFYQVDSKVTNTLPVA